MKSDWIKQMDEQSRMTAVNNLSKALYKYEQIRYGNDNQISFDAAVDEVLKQMGLEK